MGFLRDLLTGPRNDLVDLVTPRKTFADVILPEATRRQLYDALVQIEKHSLIFQQWGLGERHQQGTGLAFNFAGPPGTGKTICAEAIAHSLNKRMYRVRYSEMESCWAGETSKNIRAVFRDARTNDAVLFFDEADSIASRRFTQMNFGYEREANQSVNVLLKELEDYEGVVIFATNLAANFDPAFERRIRTHILFEMPGPAERERIWKVQFHPSKTPLADDVDLHALAERYTLAGGDIKNAVIKAAQMAAGEAGEDGQKRIHHRHLAAAVEQVVAAKGVLKQSIFPAGADAFPAFQESQDRLQTAEEDIRLCRTELAQLGEAQELQARGWQGVEARLATAQEKLERDLRAAVAATGTQIEATRREVEATREQLETAVAQIETVRAEIGALAERQETALATQAKDWSARWEGLDARLGRCTLLPAPRWAVAVSGGILMLLAVLGGVFVW